MDGDENVDILGMFCLAVRCKARAIPGGWYFVLFVPSLNPSENSWLLIDFITQLIFPLTSQLLTNLPLFGLLVLPEIKQSIQDSAVYQTIFSKAENPENREWETLSSDPSTQLPSYSRVFEWLKRLHCVLRRLYCRFKKSFSLPPSSRGRIYLITPINIKYRR